MRLHSGPVLGVLGQVLLLAALDRGVGLGAAGWVVGLGCAVAGNVLVVRGLHRSGARALGPADLVTLTRLLIACGVAALVADAFVREPVVPALVGLSAVALLLDAVDGAVARRTRTCSHFGARFDAEADAFLILVLSVHVAAALGWWVLLIGAARYLFGGAGLLLPWLRRELPPRYWRKVVAATQGVVLTVAAAGVLPEAVVLIAILLALALLVESFGRDVWWCWQRREPGHAGAVATTDVLALLLVWFALAVPNQPDRIDPGTWLRIPAAGLLLVGVALVLRPRARRRTALLAGVLLALLVLLKLVDIGAYVVMDRSFSLVSDRGHLGPAVAYLAEVHGSLVAGVAVLAAVVAVVAVLLVVPWSVRRLVGAVARRRRRAGRVLAALALVWLVAAVSGIHTGQGPVASTATSRLAVEHVRGFTRARADQQQFEAAAAVDPFADATGAELLTALRGKDVLLVFVESYGRVVIDGSLASAEVREVLTDGTDALRAAGYSARSAYLASPVYGSLSWMAHATLQSGLWVDNQRRYDWLLAQDRLTLSGAFGRAGWRTVGFLPANDEPWPEGKEFYRLDAVHGRADIDYHGPEFGWSTMPDQFALAAFRRLELTHDRPVMAEIDLASSHAPWTPVPKLLDWDDLGDGSVFDRLREAGEELRSDDRAAAYQDSIAYALESVISFVLHHGDEDLVLVLLGDHQPSSVISGHDASHAVPISIVAADPAVLDRTSAWGWQPGLLPDADAPVRPMDAFRDRFLLAFSPALAGTPSQRGRR